tara:strand:+ start:190 stop:468 length:279 start_codon:yes stop_codon:yes gene_type:complete
MAKRKTPKAKPLNKTIKKEELEQVQELIQKLRNLQANVGDLETKKHNLLHAITKTQQDFAEVNKMLETVYGQVDIDINTGEIKEKENVEVNS